MKPRQTPEEQSRVFILGFSGAQIYYSSKDRKIFSSLCPVEVRDAVNENDEIVGGESTSRDAE